ncbi:MAG: gliding motility-associated C-terminal domain-containing protein [Bacteroidales bacterium]|nr:gliding motility-associated C-terminal domain-containing protein [Bacteroidales bacterium]
MKLFGSHITPPNDPVTPLIDKAAGNNPFSTPENYFENFQKEMTQKVKNIPQAPKINIFRYVAFTMVAIVITALSIYYVNSGNSNITNDTVYTHQIVLDDACQDIFIESDDVNNVIYIHVNPNMSQAEQDELLLVFGDDENARNSARMQFSALNVSSSDDLVSENIGEDIAVIEDNYTSIEPTTTQKSINDSYAATFKLVSTSGNLMSWPEDICIERAIWLNAQLDGNYSYKWSNGSQVASIKVAETGIYSVTATSIDNSSKTVKKSILVRHIPIPVLDNYNQFSLCNGDTMSVTVRQGVDAYLYYWPEIDSRSHTVNISQPGKYTVQIQGCRMYLDSFVVNSVHCDVKVPKMISPNDDGFNDFFIVENIEKYPNTVLTIFNSNNVKVFEDKNYQNNWKADGLSDGSYYYLLKFEDGIKQDGVVTVRRK